jgi:hypothetical protein
MTPTPKRNPYPTLCQQMAQLVPEDPRFPLRGVFRPYR